MMDNKLVTLLYHDLAEDGAQLSSEAYMKDRTVSLGRFREQMQYLVDQGYHSLTMEEYFDALDGNKTLPEKCVLITFDDGLRSHYELAYPVLKELGLVGVFFVIGDRIDQANSFTKDEMLEMVGDGMEIASHGHTHTFLAYVSEKDLVWELTESKRALEAAIGRRVDFFAYPGGHYTKSMLSLLKDIGYRGACSCLYGWNDKATNPYLLKRIDIRQRMNIEDFAECFDSKNLRFYSFVYMVKGALRKVVGRQLYTKIRKKMYRYYKLQR